MTEDEYQQKYVGKSGHVLLLDKTRFRGLLVGLGIGGGAMMAAGAGLAIVALTGGLGAMWLAAAGVTLGGTILGGAGLLFSVLRVAVTSEELHVQYGMAGPRVPIESIVEVGVEKYEMMKYGGYGVKGRLIDGRIEYAYTMPTAENRVVRVRWREGTKERSMVFSSEQPDAVAAAIQRAQAMRAGGGPFRARVELEDEGEELEVANEASEAPREKAE